MLKKKVNKILLFVLFPFVLSAQIPLWGTSALAGFTGGYSDGLQFLDQYQLHNRSHDTEWHNYRLASRIATVGIGLELYGYSDNFWDGVKKGFLASAIFWITYDMGVNIGQKYPVFRVSDKTNSFMEPLSFVGIKLVILAIAVIINIL